MDKFFGAAARKPVCRAAATGVVVFALGAVWVSGSAEGDLVRPTAERAGIPTSGEVWRVPEVAPATGDPSTWKLPLEEYQVVGNEVRNTLLMAAESKVTAACLKGFGVGVPFRVPASWEEVAPATNAVPGTGPVNGMDVRYGDHDLAKVSKYGYGWADAPEGGGQSEGLATGGELPADTELALRGWQDRVSGRARAGVPRTLQGKSVPPLGCGGQAQKEISGHSGGVDASEDAIRGIERQAWDKMNSDPRTLAVWSKWSSCMKDAGHDYNDPWEANEDPRWAPSGGRSPEAIDTAKSDVNCRSRYQVSATMHEVEEYWQTQLLAENSQIATQAKLHTERVMQKVNTVLGR
ncbi:hypothetical protein ACWGBO_29590 [[Kitasatospora] papulosa]